MSCKKINGTSLLVAILLMFSCSKSQKSDYSVVYIQNLKPVAVNLSKLVSGMDLVKLETSKSCMIGSVHSIKLKDGLIYILDALTQSVFIFEKSGKFYRKLNRVGRGHGEYLQIDDFTIDNAQNVIEILDGPGKKVLAYDLDSFKNIREVQLPFTAFSFEKVNGLYYFHTHGLRNIVNGRKTNSEVLAFDPESKIIIPLFKTLLSDNSNRTFSINGFCMNSENLLFFSKAWDNTFYKIEKMEAKPILEVNAGSYDVSGAIKTGGYEVQEEFMESPSVNSKYLFFKLERYENGKMVVLFTKGTNPYNLHYYISNGSEELVTNNLSNDFIKGSPRLNIGSSIIVGNTLISIILPGEKQQPEVEKCLDSLGVHSDDNPVLALFNFK